MTIIGSVLPKFRPLCARLVEVLPDTIHLALACRFDPVLPLARYQASGELCEVRGDDLRFTLPEATEFLTRNLNPDLSRSDHRAVRAH